MLGIILHFQLLRYLTCILGKIIELYNKIYLRCIASLYLKQMTKFLLINKKVKYYDKHHVCADS